MICRVALVWNSISGLIPVSRMTLGFSFHSGRYAENFQPSHPSRSYCEDDINECNAGVCKNGAICINLDGSFKCACSQFWGGMTCEDNINECLSSPCENGGTCHNRREGFICECGQGWLGKTCAQDLDECRSDKTCSNGASCVNTLGSFKCQCAEGWQGQTCEKDIDECNELNSCRNGGECTNTRGSFTCSCPYTWTGRRCQEDVDECEAIPEICGHNGTCLNLAGDFRCHCDPGFTGSLCEQDLDECSLSPGLCTYAGNFSSFTPETNFSIERFDNSTSSFAWKSNDETKENEKIMRVSFFTPGQFSLPSVSSPRPDAASGHIVCANTQPGYKCICQEGWVGDKCDRVYIEEDLNITGESENPSVSSVISQTEETSTVTSIDRDPNLENSVENDNLNEHMSTIFINFTSAYKTSGAENSSTEDDRSQNATFNAEILEIKDDGRNAERSVVTISTVSFPRADMLNLSTAANSGNSTDDGVLIPITQTPNFTHTLEGTRSNSNYGSIFNKKSRTSNRINNGINVSLTSGSIPGKSNTSEVKASRSTAKVCEQGFQEVTVPFYLCGHVPWRQYWIVDSGLSRLLRESRLLQEKDLKVKSTFSRGTASNGQPMTTQRPLAQKMDNQMGILVVLKHFGWCEEAAVSSAIDPSDNVSPLPPFNGVDSRGYQQEHSVCVRNQQSEDRRTTIGTHKYETVNCSEFPQQIICEDQCDSPSPATAANTLMGRSDSRQTFEHHKDGKYSVADAVEGQTGRLEGKLREQEMSLNFRQSLRRNEMSPNVVVRQTVVQMQPVVKQVLRQERKSVEVRQQTTRQNLTSCARAITRTSAPPVLSPFEKKKMAVEQDEHEKFKNLLYIDDPMITNGCGSAYP
ncbi:neurogenic locus notch-like protein 1 [Plakobranchus ocellatus]|uniref:Neurogenic locus notch-like protein 1 n=1 Tax=Plakobranchus ocellatus TaxID=259542 RepID=A0AAV3YQP7_9GAST|nr:neurogenic locus notch-like protein 1 [Plakobranchus ocellatus]